jgi:hypothetical protein
MKYLLMIYQDEKARAAETEAVRGQVTGEYMQFMKEIQASGHIKGGEALRPSTMATCVRVENGKRMVTDGPYAETREQLGGYFLIEAKDLDEAIGIAARIPGARMGTIEVRPIMQMPAGATA